MPIEVHDEILKRRHVTSAPSCACCIYVVIVVFLVCAPFYIAFATHCRTNIPQPTALWLKEKTVLEQPSVTLTNKMLIVVEGLQSGKPFHRVWTSSPELNDMAGSDLIVPSVSTWSEDDNADSIYDALQVRASLPLDPTATAIHRAAVIVFLDYSLSGTAKLTMDSLAIVDSTTAVPAKSFAADGELRLNQRALLRAEGGFKTPFTATPLWDVSKGAKMLQISDIVSRYMARNFTTRFEVPYPVWEPAMAFGTPIVGGAAQTFDIAVTIRPTTATVLARTAIAEMIKWAWVQYLAIFVVIYVLTRWVRMFLFSQGLVSTTTLVDGQTKLHYH